jgi:hypothetical protein
MDLSRIEKLRQRGLTELGPTGTECVRVSIQQRLSAEGLSRSELKERIARWAEGLQDKLASAGGAVLADSMSIAAQTVEALIPIDEVESSADALTKEGARVDLVEPRQIV